MEETAIAAILCSMERNPGLKTGPVISHGSIGIDVVSFKEKHLTYLQQHPKINARNYLSNLRTMIKIRN